MERLAGIKSVLDRDAPDTAAGVALLTVAGVVCVWGILAIVSAYREFGRPDLPRWHPRRWAAPCFGFWLGWFLLFADGFIYAFLGFGVLSSPEGLAVGWVAYLVAVGAIAAVAFGFWSREQVVARRRR